MADQKVTKMVLKVDLQCPRCYKKIKKILCKFPQIRDQAFDEKQNMVTITVVCCSPEKIRGKLCCKGGKTIKSIDIVVPPKPTPTPNEPKKATAPEEPNPAKLTAKPRELEQPNEPEKPKVPEKPKKPETPKELEKPKEPGKPKEPEPLKKPEPVPGYPPIYPIVRVCFDGCFHGCERPKPCYCGCGRSAPCCDSPWAQPQPQPCYCGCGRSAPCYDGYYGKPCSAFVYYFTDENPSACTIM